MVDIDSITDLICNIKEVMKDYFYPQEVSDNRYSVKEHSHAIDEELSLNSPNPVENRSITSALNGKADEEHEHEIEDVDGLGTQLGSKSNVGHTHEEYYDKNYIDIELGKKVGTDHNHNDLYFGKDYITTELGKKSNNNHNHDNEYYTQAIMDAFLSVKSDNGHNHNSSYVKINDFENFAAKFFQGNAVRVRLIRTNSNSVPLQRDTEIDNEGTELVVQQGYKIAAKVYSIDSNIDLNNLPVTLVFIGSNGYPTVNQTTTNSSGITKGMITMSNRLNGMAYAILKGTEDYYKDFDIKYVRYE